MLGRQLLWPAGDRELRKSEPTGGCDRCCEEQAREGMGSEGGREMAGGRQRFGEGDMEGSRWGRGRTKLSADAGSEEDGEPEKERAFTGSGQ